MKQIVILSGKGGTGKTTIAAALAHLASREASIVLADLDVDAANLELVLAPRALESHEFVGGKKAVIDPELCIACGTCAEVCRFEAVSPHPTPWPPPLSQFWERGGGGGEAAGGEVRAYFIDPIACEGCAVCFYQCPAGAIRLEEPVVGRWFRSETRFGPLFHAQLFAGEENSGKLVTLVKQQARLAALDLGADYLILDGPPGIGCPVIAASAGADLALIVTEPTVAGIHDLERALATTDHFGVPALVVINKHDLSPAKSREIADYCAARGIEMVGRVPYDAVVTEAMVQGLPVTEYEDGPVSRELGRVWERIKARLG